MSTNSLVEIPEKASGNSAFVLVGARGWQGGLRNLLRAEMGKWWRSNLWWVQVLIWVLVVDGILAGVVWRPEATLEEAVMLYSIFTGLGPAIAIIIIMQDAIVGERESGTAAWILSKPASRVAFVLAKLAANFVGGLVTMVFLPGVLAYLQISLATGEWLSPLRFLGGMGVLLVSIVYYMTLTLMLGTLFSQRGPVIGIALALAFGQQMIFGLAPFLINVLPWTLAIPVNNSTSPSIAVGVILGQSLTNLTPLYVSLASIVIFIIVSLWKFQSEEL